MRTLPTRSSSSSASCTRPRAPSSSSFTSRPVIIHEPAPWFINEAAKRGVFAYITDGDPHDWQSSIDIVLHRFAEYQNLEGAFGRRAIIERAKGVLMERHSIGERAAFEMLRSHARRANRKLVDIAAAVVDSHLLLPHDRPEQPGEPHTAPTTDRRPGSAQA